MMMKITRIFAAVFVILLFLSACDQTPVPTAVPPTSAPPTAVPPTATAVPSPMPESDAGQTGGVFLSELLAGLPGSNGTEFVELYNAGSEAVDLRGWSLVYLLNSGDDETVLHQWDESAVAEIPG
ncbi:MAG: lamin tail domain-containing protein [Ardenticatenaceae bacterium]|nr:lamin tail domain-containing protein [Ardenticatenaceae bacterium]